MSWASKLLNISSAASSVPQSLQQVHQRLIHQAQALREHAAMAPDLRSERELGRMAEEDEELARRLTEHCRARGLALAGGPGEPAAPQGANHWARLARDLEAHRETHSRLLELIIHLNEVEPGLCQLLEELRSSEEGHIGRLRDLVARADPQALD